MTEQTAAPITYSAQDQTISDRIAAAGQLVERGLTDPDLAAALAAIGYDAPALQAGQALHQAAQAAFTARNVAIGARTDAIANYKEKRAGVRKAYARFRKIARALFTDPQDRQALGLTGRVPADNQKFLTQARASYTTAGQEPYQTTLATYGYPADTLAAALADLDAFAAADDAQDRVKADAKQATANRDAAAKEMNAWVHQFSQIAKVALEAQPDLYDRLFN